MARFKGKPKLAVDSVFRGFRSPVFPFVGARPGQRVTADDVPMSTSSAGVNRSAARAVYRKRVRASFPLPTPKNRQRFAPFSPPPGLRSR